MVSWNVHQPRGIRKRKHESRRNRELIGKANADAVQARKRARNILPAGLWDVSCGRNGMNPVSYVKSSLGVNRTVAALSFARMGDAIGNSILFIVIPLYVAQLPNELIQLPTPLLIGILISSYGLASAVLQPFAGTFIDRIGHYKLVIQTGLAFICISTLGFIFAGRYLDLLGLRIAQGFGLAMEIPPTMALMAIVTRQESRGGAMGFYTTFRMLGLAIGPVIGGMLHDHFGFDAAFYTGAGVLGIAVVVIQFGVQPVKASNHTVREKHTPAPKGALLNGGILSAAAATFLMASAFTLMTTLENEYNARLQIGAFGFSLAFSALMVSRLVFQVPLGRLSDRFGRRPFVIGGLLLLGPVTALLGEVTTLLQFVLLRFVQGLAAAAIVAPALAYAGDIAHSSGLGRHGSQMSIVTMGFGLGIAFGPMIAGFLAIFFFELPFLVDGALCLIGSVLVYFFMTETVQRQKRHAASDKN